MTIHVDLTSNNTAFPPPGIAGCTCGPYWSVVPPPPCPYHSRAVPAALVPYSPYLTPKELADLYRRLADALDPQITITEGTSYIVLVDPNTTTTLSVP